LLVNGWEIVEVDAQDEAQLRAWWHAARDADSHRPYDFWPTWEVARALYRTHDPNHDSVLLAAYDDGQVVGSARLRFPLQDNQHLVFAGFWVAAGFRRRGIGTALVAAGEAEALGRGRTVVLTDATSVPGEESAGTLFAAKVGYGEANLEEHKVLELASAEPGWPALQAEAADALGDYRIEVWTEIPDEHMDGYCHLLNVFMSQIPLGDLALEELKWDAARIRANEERGREVGHVSITSTAIAPDGSVAGSSDVNVNIKDPRIAHIGITLVLAEHRGHRLGLALKLANHRALLESYPASELIATSNANVNEHMNQINERMDYRVVEQFHELQKRL
jgi:GNAT superfamily N-acetyltransferase